MRFMHGQQTVRRKSIWCKLTAELLKRKSEAQEHPLQIVLSDRQIKEIVGSKDQSEILPIDNSYDPLNSIRKRAADAGFSVVCQGNSKIFTEQS